MNRHSKSKPDSSLSENMFVGMDVQKNYLQIAVLNENGKPEIENLRSAGPSSLGYSVKIDPGCINRNWESSSTRTLEPF